MGDPGQDIWRLLDGVSLLRAYGELNTSSPFMFLGGMVMPSYLNKRSLQILSLKGLKTVYLGLRVSPRVQCLTGREEHAGAKSGEDGGRAWHCVTTCQEHQELPEAG